MMKVITFILSIPFIIIGWIVGIIEFGFYIGHESATLGDLKDKTIKHYRDQIKKISKDN